jgi:hypothetical protein
VQVLPELKGIFTTAQGTQLMEILRAMPNLQHAMRTDQIEDTLVPMLLRGLSQGDTRLQEEVCSPLHWPDIKNLAQSKLELPHLFTIGSHLHARSVTGIPRLGEQYHLCSTSWWSWV